MLRSCLTISKGLKGAICKITDFSVITSICPNYHVHNLVVRKTVAEKFSFSELNIEKVKLFTYSSTKIFCISAFNNEVCLTSCLFLRSFLNIRTIATWMLIKKRVIHTYGKYLRLTFFKFSFWSWLNYIKKWEKLQFISICVTQKLHYITTLNNQLYNTSRIRHKIKFYNFFQIRINLENKFHELFLLHIFPDNNFS